MTNVPSFVGSDAPMSFFGVQDEYDPLKPNDYETFIKLRRDDKPKDREESRWRLTIECFFFIAISTIIE